MFAVNALTDEELAGLFSPVDPSLRPSMLAAARAAPLAGIEPLPYGVPVVLVGHRGAGKSALLGPLARLLGRPSVDLDAELERVHARALREWVERDEASFRAAEQALFRQWATTQAVIAVGGGFLANHPAALRGCIAVLVPVTFPTYCQRLREDSTRPRLRPALSVEQELSEVYREREAVHAKAKLLSLAELLHRHQRGARARRVVTLPPKADPERFAQLALAGGADLVEVRTDLIDGGLDLERAAAVLPLLVAERGVAPPPRWVELATLTDVELERPGGSGRANVTGDRLWSFHASEPLSPDEALERWAWVDPPAQVKHVEPLSIPQQAARLFETQRRLLEKFGRGKVTVLATGPCALPFRALLARENGLDYLALEPRFQAAPGQRLLRDATREARCASLRPRLGILGSRIHHSKSPAIHPQPFDRIELPEDAPVLDLLAALRPHYRGFAVTSPFKKVLAEGLSFPGGALNTLWRTADGWGAANTDVAGAAAVLDALGAKHVTVLGDGGACVALRLAAAERGVSLSVRRWATPALPSVSGAVVWTWPAHLDSPPGLRLDGATVAVIAYGAPGRKVAERVRRSGGTPRLLGARWFVAQARAQRRCWEEG